MKFTENPIKTYLKYTHQVLGVSHIFSSTNKSADVAIADTTKKKIFNFYNWPEGRVWREFAFDGSFQNANTIQTLFVFFSEQPDFENRIKDQTEMIAKMNQALKGNDSELAIAWLSPNAERDFFEALSKWTVALKVVLFRPGTIAKESMYASGTHKILETLTPIENPNDQNRKRQVWNDFKQWMSTF